MKTLYPVAIQRDGLP